MRILIIEDKEKHLLSAKKFAEECGHPVTIVTDYDAAEKALSGDDRFGREKTIKNFDVVMSDLMMPASKNGMGSPAEFAGKEQPYGLSLIMLAMRTGVKAVGILTDGGHHNHPMIWALDTLRGYDGKPFAIGETTILCASNGPVFTDSSWDNALQKFVADKPNHVPKSDPLYGAKDWMEFYLMLMAARSPMQAL